jgi:hypothetical protein
MTTTRIGLNVLGNVSAANREYLEYLWRDAPVKPKVITFLNAVGECARFAEMRPDGLVVSRLYPPQSGQHPGDEWAYNLLGYQGGVEEYVRRTVRETPDNVLVHVLNEPFPENDEEKLYEVVSRAVEELARHGRKGAFFSWGTGGPEDEHICADLPHTGNGSNAGVFQRSFELVVRTGHYVCGHDYYTGDPRWNGVLPDGRVLFPGGVDPFDNPNNAWIFGRVLTRMAGWLDALGLQSFAPKFISTEAGPDTVYWSDWKGYRNRYPGLTGAADFAAHMIECDQFWQRYGDQMAGCTIFCYGDQSPHEAFDIQHLRTFWDDITQYELSKNGGDPPPEESMRDAILTVYVRQEARHEPSTDAGVNMTGVWYEPAEYQVQAETLDPIPQAEFYWLGFVHEDATRYLASERRENAEMLCSLRWADDDAPDLRAVLLEAQAALDAAVDSQTDVRIAHERSVARVAEAKAQVDAALELLAQQSAA